MTNPPIGSTITSTIIVLAFLTVFIFSIVDGALPIYWKIIVCFMSGILIWGSIRTFIDETDKSNRKTLDNREDLR